MRKIWIPALAAALLAMPVRAEQLPVSLPEEDITGICLTGLPQGQLLLGDRLLQPGDVLTADQAAQMTFSPAEVARDTVTQLSYLPICADHVESPAVLTFSLRGKEDLAPVAEDSALETYKNLPNTGTLKVTEPEGQEMTFTLVRQPRRGTVDIAADGTFTYTPKKNKVGVDSFTYTAADPAGHVSREATVTVTILKPTDAPQYTDTLGQSCRFAAEWMKHTGIFVGESLGGEVCFGPEKEVSQGEFLTMVVSALELPLEDSLTLSQLSQAPQWLQPYLAAALRSGIMIPEAEALAQPISAAQAQAMVCAVVDTPLEPAGDGNLTRAQAAQLLYQAAQQQGFDPIV